MTFALSLAIWFAQNLAAVEGQLCSQEAPTASAPQPILPIRPNAVPGELKIRGEKPPVSEWVDTQTCKACHPDVVAQWQSSAHAYASLNNPLYRVAFDFLRSSKGVAPSAMCASCHDLALLLEGTLFDAVKPEDPMAHAGVSCFSCHSTVHSTRDGNGSLVLRTEPMLPQSPEAHLEEHRSRVRSGELGTSQMCGSCHRSFLDPSTGNSAAFFGMDDYGDFLSSVYSGNRASRVDEPVAQQSCAYCHMQKEPAVLGDVAAKDGRITSHRFLGAHTHLAAMRGDLENLQRISDFQKDAITLDVSSVRINAGAFLDPTRATVLLRPSDVVEFDVTIFNSGVGHRFPGGTLDNQGTYLEVQLTNEGGEVLGQSSAHELRAQVVNAQGVPLLERQTHEFVAPVWNHTVKPREARTVRYRWKVPQTHRPGSALSLFVRARLIHQSRLEALATKACAASRTDEGARYEKTLTALRGETLDGCASAPKTVLATAKARVSSVEKSAPMRPEVYFRHALGLSLSFQEYLDESRAEAFAAFRAASAVNNRTLAAQAAALMAQISARQQLVEQSLFWAVQAEGWVGKHPALEKTRGELFASVFRFEEATRHFQEAVKMNPGDIGLWQGLAASLGSLGKPLEALEAAQEGLKLFPRDAACLRIQALSLQALKAPRVAEEKAFEAALYWRETDLGPSAKAACSKTQAGCAQKRNPVPVYPLSDQPTLSLR